MDKEIEVWFVCSRLETIREHRESSWLVGVHGSLQADERVSRGKARLATARSACRMARWPLAERGCMAGCHIGALWLVTAKPNNCSRVQACNVDKAMNGRQSINMGQDNMRLPGGEQTHGRGGSAMGESEIIDEPWKV